MGSRERQDRERQAVTSSILDAARDLFVTEGYRNVSIRKIAEKIEYSPAAIYSYFASKDDIFYALAEEGFRRLDDKIHASAGGPSTSSPKSNRNSST
jgi:AcrR family transcriptional regulator